tara:strand:+ start:100 stop:681 length:582 start_codon:yes stop_codon:yes gene_type:complete
MKKLLLILLCLPLLFTTCKKDGSTIEIEEESNVNNVWQLSMQSTSLSHGDQYTSGSWLDSSTGSIYTGRINYVSSGSIMVSNDTIFPGESTSYSSRVWSINENQFITDTYYDENGFSYNISVHNFTKILDTLVISFQSEEIKKFIINELTTDQFHITSIPDTNYIPLFDVNGIYRDTLLMKLTSDKYVFNKID